MSEAEQERAQAARLPEDDVIGILLAQHVRIRELFAEVRSRRGEEKQHTFDELRALLAMHETAEEMIIRPVSKEVAGLHMADARDREEKEANEELAELERMDASSPGFDSRFIAFERSVLDHAEREEREEFPPVQRARSEDQLITMGKWLRRAEKIAPVHPHPATAGSPAGQWTAGPFASLVDRARDALKAR